MDTSNLISLAGVFISGIALVISVISIMWARRTHLSINIPSVTAWLITRPSDVREINHDTVVQKTKVHGHIRNDSPTVSAVNLSIEVTISQHKRLFRHESRQIYFRNEKTPIKPGESDTIDVTPYRSNEAGFDVGPGLEEFLIDEPLKVLRPIDQVDPIFRRYAVLNSSPITLSLKISYRPGLHGFKLRSQECNYVLVPKSIPLNEGQILTGWYVREKRH